MLAREDFQTDYRDGSITFNFVKRMVTQLHVTRKARLHWGAYVSRCFFCGL
jgi:hypothetical protein